MLRIKAKRAANALVMNQFDSQYIFLEANPFTCLVALVLWYSLNIPLFVHSANNKFVAFRSAGLVPPEFSLRFKNSPPQRRGGESFAGRRNDSTFVDNRVNEVFPTIIGGDFVHHIATQGGDTIKIGINRFVHLLVIVASLTIEVGAKMLVDLPI